jgi:outer membrane protein OmpA-like peptidoglycan-associated protein
VSLLLASLINNRIVLGQVRVRPCVDKPDETIDGFPEFNTGVDDIKDPAVRNKLRALAKRIVQSHQTPDRIIGFEIHGHSDATLRIKDKKEAAQTELEVSQERADNAQELLLSMIEDEGGKSLSNAIRGNSTTLALGAKCRKVIPARTEADMKRNRRVEIFLKVVRFRPLPPSPEPPPPPRPPEVGTHWRIQVKSGRIITTNSPVGEALAFASIGLNVVITDLDRKQQASFKASAEGVTVGGNVGVSPLPGGSTITNLQPGPPKDFTTNQGTSLSAFHGSVLVGQNPGASASVASAGGSFHFEFEGIPGTPKVDVSAGDDPLGAPQFSLGIAPSNGTLEMRGSPGPQQ